MTCEYFTNCAFFKSQITKWPAVMKMYQSNYCNGKIAKCARYIVMRSCGLQALPDSLFPNDEQGAERIMKDNQAAPGSP